MARAGKGDLVDYGKGLKSKKESKKPAVPGFDELADNETINERQEIPEQINETENEVVIEPIQEDDNENGHASGNETENDKKNESEHVHDEFTEQFLEQFNKKVTKEDTHTRQTWLIKNETIKRLDRLSKGKRKGFKTELVNQALEMFLNRIEK